MNHCYSPKADVKWFAIISWVLVRVSFPPFFPLVLYVQTYAISKLFELQLWAWRQIKDFSMYIPKQVWFTLWKHIKIIIFASTHALFSNHPTVLTIFLCSEKLAFFFQLMPFLNEKSHSNGFVAIWRIIQSRLITSYVF